mmetsp:Transcript_22963/g.54236  ORF Transcript_22963/g.54236 Transcript_22963/m.54236 type:complete len:256 (+) Transcript_22963:118-885(+)
MLLRPLRQADDLDHHLLLLPRRGLINLLELQQRLELRQGLQLWWRVCGCCCWRLLELLERCCVQALCCLETKQRTGALHLIFGVEETQDALDLGPGSDILGIAVIVDDQLERVPTVDATTNQQRHDLLGIHLPLACQPCQLLCTLGGRARLGAIRTAFGASAASALVRSLGLPWSSQHYPRTRCRGVAGNFKALAGGLRSLACNRRNWRLHRNRRPRTGSVEHGVGHGVVQSARLLHHSVDLRSNLEATERDQEL